MCTKKICRLSLEKRGNREKKADLNKQETNREDEKGCREERRN
jgi:hypothetical protein